MQQISYYTAHHNYATYKFLLYLFFYFVTTKIHSPSGISPRTCPLHRPPVSCPHSHKHTCPSCHQHLTFAQTLPRPFPDTRQQRPHHVHNVPPAPHVARVAHYTSQNSYRLPRARHQTPAPPTWQQLTSHQWPWCPLGRAPPPSTWCSPRRSHGSPQASTDAPPPTAT